MKKILIINTIGFAYEGISSVMMNYVTAMRKGKFEIEFLTYPTTNKEIIKKLCELGKIRVVQDRKLCTLKYITNLCRLIRKEKYDVVHINGNSGTMAIESVICRLCKVKIIIVHSHASKTDHPIISGILVPIMKMSANEFYSCSNSAGEWLYGKNNYHVINNAIDTRKFRFNLNKRFSYRKEFGYNEKDFVVGCIGRISREKNQLFLLDVLRNCLKKVTSIKLLIVGDGDGKREFERKVEAYHLNKEVTIVPRREDPENMYQIMDLFAFPSLHEGLGLVAIEAQANGLPCVASIGVPKETNISGNVKYLDFNINKWSKAIIDFSCKKEDREFVSKKNCKFLTNRGYDIYKEVLKLEDIYNK